MKVLCGPRSKDKNSVTPRRLQVVRLDSRCFYLLSRSSEPLRLLTIMSSPHKPPHTETP